jgi:hypothetical protein
MLHFGVVHVLCSLFLDASSEYSLFRTKDQTYRLTVNPLSQAVGGSKTFDFSRSDERRESLKRQHEKVGSSTI